VLRERSGRLEIEMTWAIGQLRAEAAKYPDSPISPM
jgi:hypothetical protein